MGYSFYFKLVLLQMMTWQENSAFDKRRIEFPGCSSLRSVGVPLSYQLSKCDVNTSGVSFAD